MTHQRQADRLANLAANFIDAIKPLPKRKQSEMLEGQKDVAEKRRSAQSDEQVLRMRLN